MYLVHMQKKNRFFSPLASALLLPRVRKKWLFMGFTLGMAISVGIFGNGFQNSTLTSIPTIILSCFFARRQHLSTFLPTFPRLFGHRLPHSSCSLSSFRRLHRRSRRSYERHLCRESWSRQHPGHTWTHVSLGTLGKSSMTVELTETLDTI